MLMYWIDHMIQQSFLLLISNVCMLTASLAADAKKGGKGGKGGKNAGKPAVEHEVKM